MFAFASTKMENRHRTESYVDIIAKTLFYLVIVLAIRHVLDLQKTIQYPKESHRFVKKNYVVLTSYNNTIIQTFLPFNYLII